MDSETTEAGILKTNTFLVALSKLEDEQIGNDFCGTVIVVTNLSASLPDFNNKTVYLCGDISMSGGLDLKAAKRVFVISELSHGYHENHASWSPVDVGQVPILVHDVGVYCRRFFDPDLGYFNRIRSEHEFQSLTQSTKPSKAHRTGIYLTPVERTGEHLHFRLLRCSTNLTGPTENFRATDWRIVDALNQQADCIFQHHAPLNHVLAQIYQNTPATGAQKEIKAKINAHADKTKDMPANGIMAFCTFYDQLDELQPLPTDPFDYGHNGKSGLTTLHFRLKSPVAKQSGRKLPTRFTVTLYPGSVFFMPLSTNRYYTHEIKSSMLDAAKLPTRLGYVVRCSSTEAVHKKGHTYLKMQEKLIKMEPSTADGMVELRKLYAEENKSKAFIDYGDKFLFSMNEGDYTPPQYKPVDEFRQYAVPVEGNLFEELRESVRFEHVSKGRQGTVLVKHDETRGTPIVRTTTRYNAPAQRFSSIHRQLAQHIQKSASLAFDLNNALIEKYTNAYATMGFHSDQALDLEDGSFIAVFSCYKYPELANTRKLHIMSKLPDGASFEVPLLHNSVVVFSLDSNQRFKHKIILDKPTRSAENPWLGITFRTSKTFVRFDNKRSYFEDGTPLTLASSDQSRAFYAYRRSENNETDYVYPGITYTISESDLVPPVQTMPK